MSCTLKCYSMLAAIIVVASIFGLVPAEVSNMPLASSADKLPTCYEESFGTRSGVLQCTAHETERWKDPQDTKLSIRCPAQGVVSGDIAFAEMKSCITSTEHRLTVIEGGIGKKYILLQLEVNNTKLLDYTAKIYMK